MPKRTTTPKKASKATTPKRTRKTTGHVSVVPAGKLRCFVTGVLRKDTPEEHVRQRMARSLVEEYGYAKSDLDIERTIQVGRAKKRADIVIFEAGMIHLNENIRIIVEAKPETVKPTDRDNGIAQLSSYLAATLNSTHGLWIGKEARAFEKVAHRSKLSIEPCLDIPFADGNPRVALEFASLVPATDSLKDVFKRCHGYIAANQGGSKEAAFQEFLKLTFCKVFDERVSASPRFYILPEEQRAAKGHAAVFARLSELFKEVIREYGYIFGKDETLNLQPNVVAYLVAELQKYTLLETEFDYKGQAYEEIVGANSRGDRGEFFTPRNLCRLAVEIVQCIVGKNKMQSMKLLDPACGTGGFLKTYVHNLHALLLDQYRHKSKDPAKVKQYAKDRLKDICDRNVYGIDFNPVLVRAAQMNLVMHGDGSSNIFHDNALLSPGEWKKQTRASVKDEDFDIIITNPPFGEELAVDDAHVLAQYELSTYESSSSRGIMAPQELFVERCYRLLKPKGIIAIVCPDNIVSNPSYKFIRHWILLKFRIIAAISLPSEMFQPSTGTATTLLVMQKRSQPFADLSSLKARCGAEPVFMSGPRKIGHDQRGNIIPCRDPNGDILLRTSQHAKVVRSADGSWREEAIEVSEIIPFDELPAVYGDFSDWFSANEITL